MRRASEKRKHPRFDGSNLWARVKVDGIVTEAELENVSLGGARLRVSKASSRACVPERNVIIELRGAQSDLRLVGRVVGVVPAARGETKPAARIRFNPSSARHLEQLQAMMRGLPSDATFSRCLTDPEAFEFHAIDLGPSDTFDIDVEGQEHEPTVAA